MKRARTTTAIPTAVISSLAKMQDGLNKFIDVDWRTKRSPNDWCLAVTIEATELMDSYPWKWWKNVKAQPDFNNVRVELVDILHFALSGTMQMQSTADEAALKALASLPAEIDTTITAPLSETANAVKTFLNVIYLAKHYKFDTITSMVIASADDLEFNLVGYYIAKHTLNYIRQLGGYKDGSYKKVQAGMEDNELLHACIASVSVAEALGNVEGSDAVDAADASFLPAWDKIMVAVYDAFKVNEAERRTASSWLN